MKYFSLITVTLSTIALVYFCGQSYASQAKSTIAQDSGIHELAEKGDLHVPQSRICENLDQKSFGKSNDEPNIFDLRQKSTQSYLTNKHWFRVLTYNILFDVYVKRIKHGKKIYTYCPVCALTMEYRLPLLREEIQGYHGDIVCLQEVDQFVFDDHLSKLDVQYGSEYGSRPNRTMGLAVLYNKRKFKLVSTETKLLRNALTTDDSLASLVTLARNNHMLMNRLLKHDANALFLVLQSVDDPFHYIVVVNTHLLAPVNADHARIVQAAVVINLLQRKLLEWKKLLDRDVVISYILCGDFNGTPRTGMIEYILSGKVPSNHKDWFSAGLNEYHGTKISLSHHLKFELASGFPTYTYHDDGYVDSIDYIFTSPATVKVNKVLEAPPHELVTKYTALPSIIAPSDHIAQVVDLSFAPPRSNE